MEEPPSEVLPGLHLCDERTAAAVGGSYDLVVNCTPHVAFQRGCRARVRLPVLDTPDDCVPLFQMLRDRRVLARMHEHVRRNGRVLVHCQAGAQRSPAVVAAYLGAAATAARSSARRTCPLWSRNSAVTKSRADRTIGLGNAVKNCAAVAGGARTACEASSGV
jgi:hypothetical protein